MAGKIGYGLACFTFSFVCGGAIGLFINAIYGAAA